MPGEQQQKHHGHYFIAADLSAVLFEANDLGDQPLPATPANGLDVFFEIAPHRKEIGDREQESDRPGKPREGAGPGDEFRPIGRRQPEKLRDHRQRQLARIARDEVGRIALGEQLISEFIADRLNMRLHIEHGTAAERLVDDVAQPPVIGIVHRQHVLR